MNKDLLVKETSREIEGATQKDVKIVLDTLIEVIERTVASGEKISIAGFGVFELVERAERTGRNPKNGETIAIPATKVPKFKAGSTFKNLVKNS